MLTRLRHRTVGGGDDEDRTVHLGRTGDHVLDVVRVTGAVDVRVVTRLRLVLDVRDRDRDTALALLGSLVDLVKRRSLVEVRVRVVQHLGNRRRQRRLTVVDVTDGADVDVRLGPLELRLSHCGLLLCDVLLDSYLRVMPQALGDKSPDDYSPRAFLMISSATFVGTSAYESNSIEYEA